MSSRRTLPGLALLVALATGCGGGQDDPSAGGLSTDEQRAADNLAAQIVRSGSVSEQGSAENGVTEEQASCVAEGAVTEVGVDSLQAYGILTEELLVDKSIQGVEMSADDADALAGVFVECIDAEALFEDRFLRAAGSDGADDARTCVEEAVNEEAVRAILAASFRGGRTDAFGALQQAVTACTGGPGSPQ